MTPSDYRLQVGLFAGSFVLYGAPIVLDIIQGVQWFISPTFIAFHLIPGTFVGAVAIAQLLLGVSRLTAYAAVLGGVAMMFGPGLGPVIGILHFHTGLIAFAVAYHVVPGAIVVWIGFHEAGLLKRSATANIGTRSDFAAR